MSGLISGSVKPAKNDLALLPASVKGNRTPLMLSIIFVLLSCLGAGLFWVSYNDREMTAVAAVDIDQGAELKASDLKLIETSGLDKSYTNVASLVGKVAQHSLKAGEVVGPSAIGSAVSVGPEETIVGLTLGPGGYPTPDIFPGDTVDIILPEEGRIIEGVKIYSVDSQGGTNPEILFSFVLSPDQSVRFTKAAQDGGLRLAKRGA